MKELKLNLTKEQAETEKDNGLRYDTPDWHYMASDWLTLYAAHAEDVALIEKLEKALIETRSHLPKQGSLPNTTPTAIGHCADQVESAIKSITAWRGEK